MKCDELKDRWFWAYPTESVDCDGITGSAHEVYSKSDVDEAIEELKQKLEEQESVIAEKDEELRHHKYKRCFGMVRCCMADNHTLSQVTLNEITNHLQWLFNENFFVKWAARWSKIADKFNDKEAK